MLKQVGRPEMVVGWYHSHPGFGCWLSGVDINTQQSFEALSERAVAVVVDPIQSVKGDALLFIIKLLKWNKIVLTNFELRSVFDKIIMLYSKAVKRIIIVV